MELIIFEAEIQNDEDRNVKHFYTLARNKEEAILKFREEHEPSGNGDLESDYEPSMFTENNVKESEHES